MRTSVGFNQVNYETGIKRQIAKEAAASKVKPSKKRQTQVNTPQRQSLVDRVNVEDNSMNELTI